MWLSAIGSSTTIEPSRRLVRCSIAATYSGSIALSRRISACALIVAAALAVGAPPAAAETAVGVIYNTHVLVSFDTAEPGEFTDARQVTGLAANEVLVDVDYRWHPNGQLNPPPPPQLFALAVTYDVETKGRLYTIDIPTGVATPVGPQVKVPYGNVYGIDFNPVADRIRVVTDGEGNFRLNPSNGARADDPTADLPLNPAGEKVGGVAYDRVGVASPQTPPASTTAYVIGTANNYLMKLGGPNGVPSPNEGFVNEPLSLGVVTTPGTPAGFDISPAGEAFATLYTGGIDGLYKVNLASGTAGLVNKLPVTLAGLAIVPPAGPPPGPPVTINSPDNSAPTVSLAGVPKTMPFGKFLKGISVKVTPSEPVSLDGELLAAAKGAKLASFNLILAARSSPLASGPRTLKLKPSKRLVGKPRNAFKVSLRVAATDAAKNEGVATATIKVKPAVRKKKPKV